MSFVMATALYTAMRQWRDVMFYCASVSPVFSAFVSALYLARALLLGKSGLELYMEKFRLLSTEHGLLAI